MGNKKGVWKSEVLETINVEKRDMGKMEFWEEKEIWRKLRGFPKERGCGEREPCGES